MFRWNSVSMMPQISSSRWNQFEYSAKKKCKQIQIATFLARTLELTMWRGWSWSIICFISAICAFMHAVSWLCRLRLLTCTTTLVQIFGTFYDAYSGSTGVTWDVGGAGCMDVHGGGCGGEKLTEKMWKQWKWFAAMPKHDSCETPLHPFKEIIIHITEAITWLE